MGITLSEIQKNCGQLDSDDMQLFVMNAVHNKECDTYLEAVQQYIEINDIEDSQVKKYLTPMLYDMLFKESSVRGVLRDKICETSIDEFLDD